MADQSERFTTFMARPRARTRRWRDGRLCAGRSGPGDVLGVCCFFGVVLAICAAAVALGEAPGWILVAVGVPAAVAAAVALRIALGGVPYLEIRDDGIVCCLDRRGYRELVPFDRWRVRGVWDWDDSGGTSVEFHAHHRGDDGRRWSLYLATGASDPHAVEELCERLMGFGFPRPEVVDPWPLQGGGGRGRA